MAAPAQTTLAQTYLPEDDGRDLAEVHSFLEAHSVLRSSGVAPRYLLVGADEHEQVQIPPSVHRLLLQVVDALNAGRAVTVAPQSMTLTTQQAADLLGVSRPTVVRLIDAQQLPAEMVGNRRRLVLTDVLEYREARRQAQYQALDEMAVDLDDEEDVEAELQRVRAARKAVAARRRESRPD